MLIISCVNYCRMNSNYFLWVYENIRKLQNCVKTEYQFANIRRIGGLWVLINNYYSANGYKTFKTDKHWDTHLIGFSERCLDLLFIRATGVWCGVWTRIEKKSNNILHQTTTKITFLNPPSPVNPHILVKFPSIYFTIHQEQFFNWSMSNPHPNQESNIKRSPSRERIVLGAHVLMPWGIPPKRTQIATGPF